MKKFLSRTTIAALLTGCINADFPINPNDREYFRELFADLDRTAYTNPEDGRFATPQNYRLTFNDIFAADDADAFAEAGPALPLPAADACFEFTAFRVFHVKPNGDALANACETENQCTGLVAFVQGAPGGNLWDGQMIRAPEDGCLTAAGVYRYTSFDGHVRTVPRLSVQSNS